jgi:hypothetical protein
MIGRRAGFRLCDAVAMDSRAEVAAHNNADWCDVVCRTHGLPTEFDRSSWLTARRSPPMYPDAVTLDPTATADEILSRIDTSVGCSVKDSYASLDLAPHGFQVLFSASWIHRAPSTSPPPPTWRAVRTPDELQAWSAAHGGGDTFRPALLTDPAVAILGAYDGDTLVTGVIANRSSGDRDAAVVGLSNLFVGATIDPARAWAEAADAVGAHFPGLPIVGYEHGDDLELAHGAGFESTGPLRIWLKAE